MGSPSRAGGFTIAGRCFRGVRQGWRLLTRAWRVLGTAVGFALTGVLSLLLATVVFPGIRLLPGTREEREIRSQRWVRRAVRILLGTLQRLGVMRLRCEGAERLRQPGILVVANHPTLLDALCLISLMPQADCVVKASRFENPFLAGTVRGAGYVSNADGPRLVEGCAERLLRGRSVIVFPEGTRSPAGGLGDFFRGSAHVALKAGCDPIPVTIRCEPPSLYRGRAWWDVPEHRFTLTLRVDDPLVIKDVLEGPMSVPRATRVVTAALRDHFERRLTVA